MKNVLFWAAGIAVLAALAYLVKTQMDFVKQSSPTQATGNGSTTGANVDPGLTWQN